MPAERLKIAFDDIGLATVLERHQLVVPRNQRSYAWTESHVRTLLSDLSAAKDRDDPIYFMGTIVLTRSPDGNLEVADGQQRLATTAIFIAAIRDYLWELGAPAKRAAEKYNGLFLSTYDEHNDESVSKLRLNGLDAPYFNRVIVPYPDEASNEKPTFTSHTRIKEAKKICQDHVRSIIAQYDRSAQANVLYNWIDFLRDEVIVISIQVPDEIDAFRMFETLNDRGLKASQTDILKNYLFNTAKEQMDEGEALWGAMVGVIESVGDDALLLDFVRHFWVTRNGPTTEVELAASIKKNVTGRVQAIRLLSDLERASVDYTAMLNPLHHPRWNDLGREGRGYLAVLTRMLQIVQIRPLILSVVANFDSDNIRKALRMFVSWSVRFLVAGGGGGGVLDRQYGTLAKEITEGRVKSPSELRVRMSDALRSDEAFREAFATHTVSKSGLARYYLRALQLGVDENPIAALGGVDDPDEYNLEHIIPLNPQVANDPERRKVLAGFSKRLGNMALLKPAQNVAIGNLPFEQKRQVLRESNMTLTMEIAEVDKWDLEEISERQRRLADIAVKVWNV